MELAKALHNFNKKKKYLLAVSGGLDSMVLLHLFRNSGLVYSVAHCNFQLREEDSNLDQKLVEDYCKEYGIELFVERFETLKLKKNRESVEMIARDLRYTFFRKLMENKQFHYLVTAHHLNDNVETFFINLLRGAGLQGLKGMEEKSSAAILRPLLHFSQKEIKKYAVKNKVEWREDYTNQTLEYLRNKLRLQIIPALEDINPAFLSQAKKSMKIIQESQTYIAKQAEELKKEALELIPNSNLTVYIKEKLEKADFILVYTLFSHYGFTSEKEIQKILRADTGKIFKNQEYILSIDRGKILIQKQTQDTLNEYIINKLPFINKQEGVQLLVSHSFEKEVGAEYLDLDRINIPLTIRKWKEGDFFYPINGNGRKKISKFLKDEKVPNLLKEKVRVLADKEGNILWVLGYRLDDRFKITPDTKSYLKLIYI